MNELYATIDKQRKEIERLNKQLVVATDRELMLRKDMDALKAHVERLRDANLQGTKIINYCLGTMTVNHQLTYVEKLCKERDLLLMRLRQKAKENEDE